MGRGREKRRYSARRSAVLKVFVRLCKSLVSYCDAVIKGGEAERESESKDDDDDDEDDEDEEDGGGEEKESWAKRRES